MADVRIVGATKHRGATLALDHIDLDVADGAFMCLLGPSGAGKTTLLRCIAGLDRLDEGDIAIGGRSVLLLSPAERDVAMVFESYALYPHLSVAENLAYPLRERRVPRDEINRRVHSVAERLSISHTLGRPPATLSGGEMQRVAIGRAIVREAQVYLFDQPLSNLDAQLRQHMRAELKRLHREIGSTLVYATPDQLEAMTMPQTIAVMRNGRVLQVDSPQATYFHPRHAFAAAYVGEPPMNFLAGTLSEGVFQTAEFAMDVSDRTSQPAECVVGVRPEDIRIVDRGCEVTPGDVRLSAEVYAVEMCGDHHVVTLALGDQRLKVVVTGASRTMLAPGAASLTFPKDRAYLIDPVTERVL